MFVFVFVFALMHLKRVLYVYICSCNVHACPPTHMSNKQQTGGALSAEASSITTAPSPPPPPPETETETTSDGGDSSSKNRVEVARETLRMIGAHPSAARTEEGRLLPLGAWVCVWLLCGGVVVSLVH